MKDLYDYNYYHISKGFQLRPERTEKLIKPILEKNPKTVLDVGAGLGAVVNELRNQNIEAYGTDFADVLKAIWTKPYFSIADARNLPFANNCFDVVFSSDFFEHIAEEDIDVVANEMKRVGKEIITFVAEDPEDGKHLNARQRQYHLTHKPLKWWVEKLKGINVYSAREICD